MRYVKNLLLPISSVFIHVRMFQENERESERESYYLAKKKDFPNNIKRKKRSCACAFLLFLIDKMYKHNEHAHICATNDAKLLNHEYTHVCIDFVSRSLESKINRKKTNETPFLMLKTNNFIIEKSKIIDLSCGQFFTIDIISIANKIQLTYENTKF